MGPLRPWRRAGAAVCVIVLRYSRQEQVDSSCAHCAPASPSEQSAFFNIPHPEGVAQRATWKTRSEISSRIRPVWVAALQAQRGGRYQRHTHAPHTSFPLLLLKLLQLPSLRAQPVQRSRDRSGVGQGWRRGHSYNRRTSREKRTSRPPSMHRHINWSHPAEVCTGDP